MGGDVTNDRYQIALRDERTGARRFVYAFRFNSAPTDLDPTRYVDYLEDDPEQREIACVNQHETTQETACGTAWGDVSELPGNVAATLRTLIAESVAVAEAHAQSPERQRRIADALTERLFARARSHGCAQSDAELTAILGTDIGLNAQGLDVWLDKREERKQNNP